MNIIPTINLDLPNIIVGAILGGPIGYAVAYAAHARYDRNQAAARASSLQEKYGKLAGAYANYRSDGSATGGSIELTQKPDGSFDVVGLHANRTIDWESVLWMDEKFENVGIARYLHKPGHQHGVQFMRYVPETGELHVKGTRESPGAPLEFHHIWRPKR